MELNFDDIDEFRRVFVANKPSYSWMLVKSISDAIESSRRSAKAFEFIIGDTTYEVSVPSTQWEKALTECLDYFHKEDMVDEQIDTWSILEKVKTFKK